MNTLDGQYIKLLKNILDNGTDKGDRTGTGTRSISGAMIQHDMAEGFPALTTKRLYFRTMAVELEGFIKGITDKHWYKSRKCNIWNEWSNPKTRPIGIKAEDHNDLGPIYGSQWRNFNGDNYDQLQAVMDSLENKPTDRRMIVSAWNPLQLSEMALPPCHILWQVIVRDNKLDLLWYQRSVDTFLGLPFNIASYGLLLSLLAKQFGYEPGILTGFLGDTHIYNNHREQVKEQMSRIPFELPTLVINDSFSDVRSFNSAEDIKLDGYEHHPAIKAQIAI